jgi:hypothetical protein
MLLMPRVVLIVLSFGVCAARVHSHHLDVLREMSSCLRVVRHAVRRSAPLTHTVCSTCALSTDL